MAELYPVQNDYPDPFKIPPANRIDNPGARTLYLSSTGFEKALADTEAERLMDLYAEAIIDEWNPWQVAYEHLPFLAWAQGVNLWESWWDETFKRDWVARQWYLKSVRGKRAGLNEFVTAVGGHVKRCIVPPARAYGTKAMTDAERAAYVARFPQLRIYPYVARSLLPWLCFNGVHWDGTGQNRVWTKNGSFLGPRRPVYPTNQDAGGKYTRTATLYEPRTGIETKLTIRRIVKIDTGPNAGWGFTPGVSQYDDTVILPLLKRPNYFIGEHAKYLGVNIYLGIELPLRTISLHRSGPMDLIQAKAQYQTVFPQADLLQVRPEMVAIRHPRRKTELYAARGEYLIRAKEIVTHAVASNLVTGSPVFSRAVWGLAANPFNHQAPTFGTPVLTPTANIDPATAAWVTAIIAAGGSVSTTRRNLINNFVIGLRTDNIWNKFDRMLFVAGENQQSARVDIKVGTLATPVGSPVFTANMGYTCSPGNYINTNYNFVSDGVTYTRDSAHLACWNLTDGPGVDPAVTANTLAPSHIHAKYTDNLCYARINDSATPGFPIVDARGLLVGNRSTSTSREIYQNGASLGVYTGFLGSLALVSQPLYIFSRQIAFLSVGGSLNSYEQFLFFARVRTLMTAIGIP